MSRLIVLFGALFVVGGCREAPADAASPAPPPSGRCVENVQGPYMVMHVSDGDTIVVRGEGYLTVTQELLQHASERFRAFGAHSLPAVADGAPQ